MNMSRLPDDDEIEREWHAQEHALAQERRGLDAAADAAGVQRYRLLARALRQPPVDLLPADFARRVAARAAADAAPVAGAHARFEWRLLQGMIGVFGLVAAAVIATYGADWLPALSEAMRLGRLPGERWLFALLACVGASIAAQRVRPLRDR
ncbi:MAG TPA: hypothetical protein VGC55_14330 [Dokdonella sp.]